MQNNLSSYQKLKMKYDELYRLHYRAMKKLHDLGEGLQGDDLIMDFHAFSEPQEMINQQ